MANGITKPDITKNTCTPKSPQLNKGPSGLGLMVGSVELEKWNSTTANAANPRSKSKWPMCLRSKKVLFCNDIQEGAMEVNVGGYLIFHII